MKLNNNETTKQQQQQKMSNRAVLKNIAAETLTVLTTGVYKVNEHTIDISDKIKQCVENSVLYEHSDTFHKSLKIEQQTTETEIEVVPLTTLQTVQQEIVNNNGNIAALNFASAKNPGGGFIKGSNAQEESIARTSALYSCLTSGHVQSYYNQNEKEKTCIYTDNIIYSPNVVVFRSDQLSGEFLEEPYVCSIITAPAVNYTHAIKRVNDASRVKQAFYNRADKVLAIAYRNNVEVLVLGAWGCGVFGCSIHDTAQMFRHFLINDNAKYKNVFKKVIFAIYGEQTYEEFKESLSTHSTTESSTLSMIDQQIKPIRNSSSGGGKKRRDAGWKKRSAMNFNE